MKKRIITNDRDVYEKLMSLNFTNEVFIRDPDRQFNKIVKNINRTSDNITVEKLSQGIIVKKNRPFKFDIFFSR